MIDKKDVYLGLIITFVTPTMKNPMTDEEVYASIQKGGNNLEVATSFVMGSNLGFLYKIKSKFNLSNDDVKDLYADAISSLIWNIRSNKFNAKSKISSYLYRIFYNKSVDYLRHISTNKNVPYLELKDDSYDLSDSDTRKVESSIDASLIKKEIEALDTECKGIILDWAYWGYSMKEIAERNNLEDADKAKKRKYECLKRLRLSLKTKGIL